MQPWDVINPVAASVIARQTPDAFPDVTLGWFPEVEVQDVRFRRQRTQTVNSTARFRSWNAESPVGERGATMTIDEGRFPPISEKLPLDEIDQIELFLAQRDGTVTGPALDQLLELIYNDIVTLTRRIRNRMTMARGDVLVDGKFTLAGENGLTMEADFGMVANQKPTAGTLWTNTSSSVPVTDEQAWIAYLSTLSNSPITRSMTSTRIVNALLANGQYRQLWMPGMTLANIPTLTGLPQLNQIRAGIGLPPIVVNDHALSVDGVTTRVVPDNLFILGAASIGRTEWGITPDALNLAKSGAVVTRAPAQSELGAAGLIAGTWFEEDPITKWTKVSGAGMPLLLDQTGILTATVA